jgi:aldehyde:ferredoxin oxidoreductase
MSLKQGGYTGRFLRVNLTSGTITTEETPDPSRWLGARGWNAILAWREMTPGIGPFDPDNRIILSAGPLVGTGAPTAGRMTFSTIGPRGYPEPIWTSASMGGYLGAELKYAGYDGIVIQGQAGVPCYLLIEDEQVSLEDAGDLWGKGTFATQRALKERHTPQHQIATIGPAGENRVRFASIIHRLANAVGNGGFGGVMGAKRLKAICVRGSRGVPIANPARFLHAVERVWKLSRGGVSCVGQIEEGYPLVACSHGCSMKCGTRIATTPSKLPSASRVRMLKCQNGAFMRGSHAAYEGVHVDGSHLVVPRPPGLGEVGLDLGNMIEDLGMTAWFYDSWYRYLGGLRGIGIHDLEGYPIELESPEWWRNFMTCVAHREGIGDDIAEGLARFYDKHAIGPRYLAEFIESSGSRGHGWHREGRAMEPHPSPFWEHSALLYATSTRDVTASTHGFFFLNSLYGYPKAPVSAQEIPQTLLDLSERLYGSRETMQPGIAGVEHGVLWHQHRAIIKDSLGLCDWIFPILRRTQSTQKALSEALHDGLDAVFGDPAAEADLYAACTGIEMDIATMERPVAERIVTLERLLDVRNFGRSRADDEAVIPHYQWSDKTDGTHLSSDAAEFRALLDRYYTLRGWDGDGIPTEDKLRELGLDAE